MPDFSPAQPWRLFHPPAPSLPRQTLRPGTRLFPSKTAANEGPRQVFLEIEGRNCWDDEVPQGVQNGFQRGRSERRGDAYFVQYVEH